MKLSTSLIALLYCYVGHGYAHLFMLLYPTVILGLSDVFSLGYDELLAMATPGFIAFGAGSVPAGWLGQKWSAKGMLVVFFIGTGAASCLTGMASSPWGIGLGLTLIGAFASIYHPVGINILVAHTKNLGKTLGVNGMAGNLGTAMAPLVAGSLMALLDWRMAFIIPGAVAIVTGIAFALMVSDTHVREKAQPQRLTREITRRDLIRVFSFLSIATISIGITYNAVTVALPKLFEEGLGYLAANTAEVGAWVTGLFTLAAIAQLITGHLMDKYPLKPLYIGIFTLQAPLLFLMAYVAELPLVLVGGLMLFAVIGAVPLGDALIARYADEKWRSTIYGLKFVLALGVAAAGIPLVAFMRHFTGSFDMLFMLLAGVAALSMVMAFVLPGEGRSESYSPAR